MQVGSKRFKTRRRWKKLGNWIKGRYTPGARKSYGAYKASNPLSIRYSKRYVRNKQLGQYKRWFKQRKRTRFKQYIKKQHRGW